MCLHLERILIESIKSTKKVHGQGLKFGLYIDITENQADPDLMALDAKLLAKWDIDYVKLNGWSESVESRDKLFSYFGRLLFVTGHPMVYSCAWHGDQECSGTMVNCLNVKMKMYRF